MLENKVSLDVSSPFPAHRLNLNGIVKALRLGNWIAYLEPKSGCEGPHSPILRHDESVERDFGREGVGEQEKYSGDRNPDKVIQNLHLGPSHLCPFSLVTGLTQFEFESGTAPEGSS